MPAKKRAKEWGVGGGRKREKNRTENSGYLCIQNERVEVPRRPPEEMVVVCSSDGGVSVFFFLASVGRVFVWVPIHRYIFRKPVIVNTLNAARFKGARIFIVICIPDPVQLPKGRRVEEFLCSVQDDNAVWKVASVVCRHGLKRGYGEKNEGRRKRKT